MENTQIIAAIIGAIGVIIAAIVGAIIKTQIKNQGSKGNSPVITHIMHIGTDSVLTSKDIIVGDINPNSSDTRTRSHETNIEKNVNINSSGSIITGDMKNLNK